MRSFWTMNLLDKKYFWTNFRYIKYFDPSTPSMRKGRYGGKKNGKKTGGKKREKTDDYSGHYVIASS